MHQAALNAISPGRWGIGVSGGADSVALLMLMLGRVDIQLHVIHLDHETRDGESGHDSAFVADLASRLRCPATIVKRSAVEESSTVKPNNLPSRYRQARLSLFAQTVARENLQGVLLAHHADDQAETILLRILRGASAQNLAAMRPLSHVHGVTILRPLLDVPSSSLKNYLKQIGQPWREDSSNQSGKYRRNLIRFWLADHPELVPLLLRLAAESLNTRSCLDDLAPNLDQCFAVELLDQLPEPLAQHSAARWLIEQGVPPALTDQTVCNRLINMASDAATSWRRSFPGNVLVARRRRRISADK